MKKMCFVLVLILLLSININISAETKDRKTGIERLQYDRETSEIIKMDTSEVLEKVLENPFLIDILAYDDISIGLNKLVREYNIMKELYKRDDLVYTFMNYHSEKSRKNNIMEVVFLNLLMSYSNFISSCKSVDKTLLLELSEANVTQYFPKDSILEYSLNELRVGFNMQPYEFQHWCNWEYTVYTYKGSPVTICCNDLANSASTITQLRAMVAECYPNAIELEGPSYQYNCHAYAWYFESQSNLTSVRGCIFAPTVYVTDGSYSEIAVSSLLNGEKYKIAYYIGGGLSHSGVIESYNSNNVEVVSKWGVLGLYRHKINETPYGNCTYRYYKHIHEFEYQANSNGMTHVSTCCCGYSYNEPHNYVQYNKNYKCEKCNYVFQMNKEGGM